MRLGVFGGSFDPPHVGHLLAADDACSQLALDRLVFVPAGTQPLKQGTSTATPAQRLAMVRALVEGDARFDVSDVEVARPGLSFTVDTVRHFATQYPSAERFLLLGADVVATFAQWRDPQEIVRLARPVVLVRDPQSAPAELAGAKVIALATRRIDLSSTEVRERVRQGQPIHGLVPERVAALIERDGLYR